MNKAAIWVIVIILAAVGIWLFTSRGSTPPAVNVQPTDTSTPANEVPSPANPSSGSPETNEVVATYTDSGYQPAELRIKVGQTVVFKNESSGLMWTASATHPTHLELPGFDSLKGIAVGQTYSYTFTKAGSWGFHDHLHPSFYGVIVVE